MQIHRDKRDDSAIDGNKNVSNMAVIRQQNSVVWQNSLKSLPPHSILPDLQHAMRNWWHSCRRQGYTEKTDTNTIQDGHQTGIK